MEKGYNGWANYETWLFNVYHGYYMYECLEDMKEDGDVLDYGKIHTFVEGHIDMILEQEPADLDGFLSDILGKGIQMIDTHEIASHLAEELGVEDE